MEAFWFSSESNRGSYSSVFYRMLQSAIISPLYSRLQSIVVYYIHYYYSRLWYSVVCNSLLISIRIAVCFFMKGSVHKHQNCGMLLHEGRTRSPGVLFCCACRLGQVSCQGKVLYPKGPCAQIVYTLAPK